MATLVIAHWLLVTYLWAVSTRLRIVVVLWLWLVRDVVQLGSRGRLSTVSLGRARCIYTVSGKNRHSLIRWLVLLMKVCLLLL